ncbi:hypothetical protein SAMN05518854_11422 [Variovorax sp. YR266]|nr:hypothetical protein SAMN05518854_11422 [Variovorax sp. YR266]
MQCPAFVAEARSSLLVLPSVLAKDAQELLAPDVSIIAESGVSGVSGVSGCGVLSWFGLYQPRSPPPQLTQHIDEEVVQLLGSPEMAVRSRRGASSPCMPHLRQGSGRYGADGPRGQGHQLKVD